MTSNSITDNAATFNILDHIDSPNLCIVHEKSTDSEWVCVCPICGDDNLKIARAGSREGAYQCFSNNCDIDQIREAIAPFKDKKGANNSPNAPRNKKVIPIRPVAAKKIEGRIELAKLPDDVADTPEVIREDSTLTTIYSYTKDFRVLRIEKEDPAATKGRTKTFYPQHFSVEKNEFVSGKGEARWPLYKELEAINYGKNKWVISFEGEKSLEAARSLKLVGFTPQGSDYRAETIEPALLRLQKAGVAGVIILPDNDTPGKQKADKLEAVCNKVGLPCIMIDPTALYPAMPEAGDIADWIALETNMTRPQFIEKLEEEIHRAVEAKNKAIDESESRAKDERGKALRNSIKEILDDNLSAANRKTAFIELAKDSGVSLKYIEDLADLLESEEEKEEFRSESTSEINTLIKATESSLDIFAILPNIIAQLVCKIASLLNLRPETYLTALLVVVSTLHKVGTTVMLNRTWDFEVSPNLYGGIVAESSQKKSPILSSTIFKPLGILQDRAKEEFKHAKNEYKRLLEEYKSMPKEDRKDFFPDGEPEKPRQKLYYFDKASGEGLINQIEAFPQQGVLYAIDELAALFKSQNQYRGGRGSDEEDLLSFYDGRGSTVLRADGLRANLNNLILGIFGGIQPAVLRTLMQDLSDSNGKWARFIFVVQPIAISQMGEDSGMLSMTNLLADLYAKIDALPPARYCLDSTAFKTFRDIYNEISPRRKDDPSQAMRAYWGKSEGRIGKLAVNLHVIHELSEHPNRQPSIYIPKERIQEAEILTYFYADQIRALHIQFADATALEPQLANIITLSKNKGWLKPSDVTRSITGKHRPKAKDVVSWFKELVDRELGVTRRDGRSVLFNYESKIDENRRKIDESSIDESCTQSGFQPQNRQIDEIDDLQNYNSESVVYDQALADQVDGMFTIDDSSTEQALTDQVEDSTKIDDSSTEQRPSVTDDQVLEIEMAGGDTPEKNNFQKSSISSICLFSASNDLAASVSEIDDSSILSTESSILTDPSEDDPWSDPDNDDPLDGGGGQPVEPSPQSDNDGGCAAAPTPETVSTEASAPTDTTNNEGVEWLEPEAPNYQEQCHAIAAAPIIALDVETYQPDKPKKNATPKALHPWQSGLRFVQLCTGERTFLIDFGDRNSDFEASLNQHQPTIELLRQVLQNPDQRIVGHNIHFDLRFLATKLGIRNAKNVICTRIGAQVYYGDYGSPEGQTTKGKHNPILTGGYSLANLAQKFLGITLDKTEQKSDFGAELTEEQINYAAKDPQITLRVYESLETLYNDDSKTLYSPNLIDNWQLECAVIPCAIEIELAGMPLDIEAAKQQLATIEAHKKKLLQKWSELCPGLKYTQRDKLITHLNQEYQLGLEKLNKGALNKKSRENPLIQIKLKIQGLDAQANNLKGFLNSAARDGRVHTTYKTLTGFGRFSSGGGCEDLPNLQSIKAKTNPILKEFNLPDVRAVIKPAPGRTMAVIDLAGAHGRIAASETQDETAIAGNNDDTVDNHSKVAVSIAKAQGLNWSWEQIADLRKQKTEDGIKAKLFRDTAKNTYYGWLNGAGWQRIQEQITSNTGITPTETECKAAIEGCKKLYPGVLNHRNRLMIRLRHQAILLDGRKIAVNKISDGFRICMPLIPNKFEPNRLEAPYTQSLACIWSRIEATAVKKALIQVMELRQQHPEWGLEVINYVHDEIDIEVNTEVASIAVPLVNNIIGDCFAALLNRVNDGRETNWEKLIVNSWADK